MTKYTWLLGICLGIWMLLDKSSAPSWFSSGVIFGAIFAPWLIDVKGSEGK